MFTAAFWVDAFERAVKTFAQTALSALGANAVDILHTDLTGALSLGAGAALVSVLMSLGSERLGNAGTASATRSVEPTH